jgi:hypothetical protein
MRKKNEEARATRVYGRAGKAMPRSARYRPIGQQVADKALLAATYNQPIAGGSDHA